MNLYLVRHAVTDLGLQNRNQYPKTPLSSEGRLQAQKLASRFRGIPLDLVISSPFTRALETAQIITADTGYQVKISPLFSEVKKPSEVEGKTEQETISVNALIKQNILNPHWHYSDEENYFDFYRRVLKARRFLEGQTCENLLVVTHANLIGLLIVSIIFGREITLDQVQSFKQSTTHSNTGITHCRFEDGKWRLITWNDQSHRL